MGPSSFANAGSSRPPYVTVPSAPMATTTTVLVSPARIAIRGAAPSTASDEDSCSARWDADFDPEPHPAIATPVTKAMSANRTFIASPRPAPKLSSFGALASLYFDCRHGIQATPHGGDTVRRLDLCRHIAERGRSQGVGKL